MAKRSTSKPSHRARGDTPYRPLPLGDLRLDSQNPRLPEEEASEDATQSRLLEVMVRHFALKDLGRSFADRGFCAQEPLVVIGPSAKGTYTVVEGNRRLAALRLLSDAKARERLTADREWDELAREAATHDLGIIPCIVADSRRELTSFLGFRHVSGILEWEPVEQARFINQVIERDKLDFRQTARMIGSRSDAVRRRYVAYRILVQAREEFGIDAAGATQRFGVFYRSLSTGGVRQFIGLRRDRDMGSPAECRRPIGRAKRAALEELFSFMFGDEDHGAVLTDSRLLTELGEVLESKPALQHLRANRRLEVAWELSEGEESRLITTLQKASDALDNALRDVHRHARKAKVGEWVGRCCGSLQQIAAKFPPIYRKYFRGDGDA